MIGGMTLGGSSFGAGVNYSAALPEISQFDFYYGGGLDVTYLGLAECDAEGNVNVGKFGTTITGCGGFIDISQSTKTVFSVEHLRLVDLKRRLRMEN